MMPDGLWRTACGDPQRDQHDAIGEAVAVIHEAYCGDPDDPRCFGLRLAIERVVERVYR